MKQHAALVLAGLTLVLSLAGCAADGSSSQSSASDDDGWTCTGCRTSEPTNTAAALPTTVIVPDASKSTFDEVTKMKDLGLNVVVLDASGTDITNEYLGNFGSASVFVSQSPSGGTEVADHASVTVKLRDPKVVVSADFSGPGGSITSLEGTSLSQITDAPQHWDKVVPYGDSTDYTFTNPYAAGTLTCKITQEGEVVQTNTASGPFASTTC